jgi:hypothetical protein
MKINIAFAPGRPSRQYDTNPEIKVTDLVGNPQERPSFGIVKGFLSFEPAGPGSVPLSAPHERMVANIELTAVPGTPLEVQMLTPASRAIRSASPGFRFLFP